MGKRKKRHLWHKTPYDGVPGVYAAIQRFLYQFEGPSQLGDRDEPAYVAPANPLCPVCQQPLRDHRIDRGGPGKPTHMTCPPAPAPQQETTQCPEAQSESKSSEESA